MHNLRGWGIDLIITACSKMMQQSVMRAGINETDYSLQESDRSLEEQPRAHKNRISTVDHQTPRNVRTESGVLNGLIFWCSQAGEKCQQLRQRFGNKSWTPRLNSQQKTCKLDFLAVWIVSGRDNYEKTHHTMLLLTLSCCGKLRGGDKGHFEQWRLTGQTWKTQLNAYVVH